MTRRRPAMPARSVRVDDETWQAANAAAVARSEFLHDEIRAFLKRYAVGDACEPSRIYSVASHADVSEFRFLVGQWLSTYAAEADDHGARFLVTVDVTRVVDSAERGPTGGTT